MTNIEELKSEMDSKGKSEVDMLFERYEKLKIDIGELENSTSSRDSTIIYFNQIQFRIDSDKTIEGILEKIEKDKEVSSVKALKKTPEIAPYTITKVPNDASIKNAKIFKVMIWGHSEVGKSCILARYTNNTFVEKYDVTIGVEFNSAMFKTDNEYLKLQIWDTAGKPSFRSITRSYYRGVQIVFIVYDISNKSSFDELESFMDDISMFCSQPVWKILVGNKADLEFDRQVTYEMAMKFVEKHSLDYFIEISWKTNQNIDKLFEDAVKLRLEQISELGVEAY